MSLHPTAIPPVPEETARVARAVFSKPNRCMQLRDELGTCYRDDDFRALFPRREQPAEAPWRLALVTVLQFMEGLSDRQAAEAVRARIDWKYALSLELTDAGFDYSVLSEFRARLVGGNAEDLLLEKLLAECKARGYLRARSRQRTDSTHVLAAVRVLNRLEGVTETLRAALNSVAAVAPEWLQGQVPLEWYERYSRRVEESCLPKGEAARRAYALPVGTDGCQLLQAVAAQSAPVGLAELPALSTLRRMWAQQYEQRPDGALHWRTGAELPPSSERLDSPYDPEAPYRVKRETEWVGYKVHLTETCEPEAVHLITHVETTPSVVPDVVMTESIERALVHKELAPSEHLLDGGYVAIAGMVRSQAGHQITQVGPLSPDHQWQARAGEGYDLSHFQIDWAAQRVTCPPGRVSVQWGQSTQAHGGEGIHVRCRPQECRACGVRATCTRAKDGPRELTLRPQAQQEQRQAARQEQTTANWQKRYNVRAGIEGTLSQGIRAFELRKTRYSGLAKTHLQHLITAAALNIVRLVNWLNEVPLAKTRQSRFAALAPAG